MKEGENLRWYERAAYALANAVLPAAVKRQMVGSGRMTTARNSSPVWGMFDWLPRKYQQAHNIDMSKLKSYTADELLELLISTHPDVSFALYNYLRMGDTPLTLTAKKPNGDADKRGQKLLDELKEMLNTPLPSPGYQHGRSLDKLDTIQRMMIMVRGACAGEVVLNERCTDVVDIVPVDPSTIWFRREADGRLVPWQYVRNPMPRVGEEWFGSYKRIDTPTFIYEEFDPMVDDPYGRTPMLPVLQVVFFHMQVLEDLKAVVHNQGYPRLDVSVLEEILIKNMPANIKNNAAAQADWLKNRLEEFEQHFSSLNPDDALIHWDSVKVDYLKTGGSGPMIDVKKLIDIIDTQMATGLKTLLTMLSRHQGSTESYSAIDTKIYIKNVESARSVTKRFWQRAFSLCARVRGAQMQVEVDYLPIDLRSENEVEKDRKAKLDNYAEAERQKYITPQEAAEEVRWSFGLNPKIPAELLPELEAKSSTKPAAAPEQTEEGGE